MNSYVGMIVVPLLFCAYSCSAGKQDDKKFEGSQSSSSAEAEAEDERPSPPNQVAGSFLFCADQPSSNPNDIFTRCALRNVADNQKVAIESLASRYSWNAEQKPNVLSISERELQDDPDWQVEFHVTVDSPNNREKVRRTTEYRLAMTLLDGTEAELHTGLPNSSLNWLNLNGNSLPQGSTVGGSSENKTKSLYLCRIYVDGEVLPGKLVEPTNSSSSSICYSVSGSARVDSSGLDPSRMEVMALKNGDADDYLEWVPVSNGEKPALSLITGIDRDKNPIYSCRGLAAGIPGAVSGAQKNSAEGEMTPGYLKQNATSCTFFYYETYNVANYEVLAWKSAAIKALFEGTPVR